MGVASGSAREGGEPEPVASRARREAGEPERLDSRAADPSPLDVLVVDDEPRIRTTLTLCLRDDGHRVESVGSGEEALRAAERSSYDVAFVDIRLPGMSGLELLSPLLERLPWLKVIVITAHATVESAVEAMKLGATDYLPKPFSTSEVRLATRKVAEVRALENRLSVLEREMEEGRPPPLLESGSARMRRVLALAREVADTDATILLTGATGTGKGILARTIHGWSRRRAAPFGVAHCPSFPAELLESELFGHVKGAFTGAVGSNPGRVARCEGGTLLLDEVGELPSPLQPKLLRFLESREYERLGDPTVRRADVRIVAATNRDLEEEVERGRFRGDLYYRLAVIEIELPTLRERPEDVLPLARHFLAHYARRYGREAKRFSEEAERILCAHSWPGNVRELANLAERVAILSRRPEVGAGALPLRGERARAAPAVGETVSLATLEEEHIRRVVARAPTLEEAAEILGIDTTTLWRRRKQYGI